MSAASPLRVLLIEDGEERPSALMGMLDQFPARHDVASHPVIGLTPDGLGDRLPDLILLDLDVPGPLRSDVLRRIRTAAPHTPLVVLVPDGEPESRLLALREGAHECLSRPGLDAAALEVAMRCALERQATRSATSSRVEHVAATLHSIGEAIVATDALGAITFFNPIAEGLTGWPGETARGRPLGEVIRLVDALSRKPIPLPERPPAGGPTMIRGNHALIRRDGNEVAVEGSLSTMPAPGGTPSGCVLLLRDVSVDRAMARQMAHSAQHDFLTGLPNRVLLNDRIASAVSIAPRHRKKVALLFLDLDGFKGINDSLGHLVGDKLLQSVTRRLIQCVRGSDTVSRQGGDEFVVLLSEIENPEDAAITARRMIESVSAVHSIEGSDVRITTSIGIAVCPDDGSDAETLIKNADTAMYQAKENGRDGFQFYKPAMNLRAVERQDYEDALRRGLENDEFVLHFQPRVNLRTGQICGAEALVRWQNPARGTLMPGQFLPVAEASGLIGELGGWVLREACRQIRRWQRAGLGLSSMSVNVSSAQVRAPKFLDTIFDALNATGLEPGSLELEVTEGTLIKHADIAEGALQALRAAGVRLAVDDFGTGYSSLTHLRRFPVHMLKIDHSFVREIGSEGENRNVVGAVLSMAHGLGLRVTAEGVETADELAFLQYHRCDEAQGYYFSRPLPAPQFERLLRDGLLPTMAARVFERSGGTLQRAANS